MSRVKKELGLSFEVSAYGMDVADVKTRDRKLSGRELFKITRFPDFVKLWVFLESLFCLINLLRLVVMMDSNVYEI